EAKPGDVPPGLASPAWDRALATGRARWRHPGDKWTLEVTGEGGPIPARYYPASGHGHHTDRMMVWFSPDGTRIVRAEPWGGYLMSWLYQLHMALLAGDLGGQVVGWSGVAMLVLLVSGIAAWWPRGSWRKALAFKRDAAPIRRLRDLHKLSGLWSMALLFVLVATGVLLALPAVTQALLAPATIPAPKSAGGGDHQIAIVEALYTAHRALPDGRIVFIDIPGAGDAPIRVRLQVPGDPHRRFPGSYVFIDQFSGLVLAVHDVRRAGTGTAVASWIRTLHDGTVGGVATRILAVLIGFVPTILLTTGILHWLRRRKAARTV
ncbi:PepSY-associated TM helix domain-containing protein, partial [Sphingomonas adhaesiva]